eukprot:TRINITY_DN2253_c2_g1_i1.p1 TRINITY_DN2253_c2_g1~~TRINITY_DN2253_c2_g1_i1.p1  ORF type:complete len:275 (-),score=81.43 TRINITY_DN2253_c2_g1_i1:13-837(-)
MQKEQGNTESNVDAYSLEPIGYIRSCFPKRMGTPRQGLLVDKAYGHLELSPVTNPTASLCNLDEYSYVWIIFLFHENTNPGRKIRLNALNTQMNQKNISTVKSKVVPPRLAQKVGLFSTRTPHRPNPIGLSIAKIESIDASGRLHLSGLDLVDGTPVLDIKPYIPNYDSITNAITPDWIHHTPSSYVHVYWEDAALHQLEQHIEECKHFQSVKDVKDAIDQLLTLDIRTQHQRSKGDLWDCKFRFDVLQFVFCAEGDAMRVKQVFLFSETMDEE